MASGLIVVRISEGYGIWHLGIGRMTITKLNRYDDSRCSVETTQRRRAGSR